MEEYNKDDLLKQLNNAKIRDYAPAIAYSAIVVILGIIGNIISVSFYGFKVPRTTTNIIITALAIVDLITCIVISDEIVELCFTLTFTNVGGCKAMYFLNHTLVLSSGFMLLFVAFDRFRRICRPFNWQLSTLAVGIAFPVIICVAISLSVRDWFIIDVVPVDIVADARNVTVFYCTHSRDDALHSVVQVFQIIDLLTLVIVIGGVLVLYVFISKRLWNSRKHVNNAQRHGQTLSQLRGSVLQSSTTDTYSFQSTDITTEEVPKVIALEDGSAQSKGSDGSSDKELKAKHVGQLDEIKKREIEYAVDNGDKVVHTNKHVDHAKMNRTHKGTPVVERKVTVMMLTITIVSLLSFVPYFIVNLWIKQNSNSSASEFNAGIQIALRSYMINNAVNPYIIGFFNSKFRRYVKSLLRCNR